MGEVGPVEVPVKGLDLGAQLVILVFERVGTVLKRRTRLIGFVERLLQSGG